MNFEQAKGAIKDASNYDSLLRAMGTAKASANWPRYTSEQQEELCRLPVVRSGELAEQARKDIAAQEAKVVEAVERMANPNVTHL